MSWIDDSLNKKRRIENIKQTKHNIYRTIEEAEEAGLEEDEVRAYIVGLFDFISPGTGELVEVCLNKYFAGGDK
jgi:hypothetical protein